MIRIALLEKREIYRIMDYRWRMHVITLSLWYDIMLAKCNAYEALHYNGYNYMAM